MTITFKVSDVSLPSEENKYWKPELVSINESFNKILKKDVEACSVSKNKVVSCENAFVDAVYYSYNWHLPLALSPDDVWIAISQGFANHVVANAEELRHKFVDFDGKKELIVYCDEFIKGNPDNNWQGVFPEFSKQIAENIGEKQRDLIVSNFSTTGIIEKAASEIVLMNAMKSYFSYTCMTCCGHPSITLLGEVEDWVSIKNRVQALGEYNLSWWTNKLTDIIDEFVKAAKGNANIDFWKSIYKNDSDSGATDVNGWITSFFPYIQSECEFVRNDKVHAFLDASITKTDRNRMWNSPGGLYSNQIPCGLCKVPFNWIYYMEKYKMEFASGFVGYSIGDNDKVVKPVLGWAVKEE